MQPTRAAAPRRSRTLSGALLAALGLAVATVPGCAPPPPERTALAQPLVPPPKAPPAYDQKGVASWYGRAHKGRETASGERFDDKALTAAHRSLPFGTRVRVTNLDNGRSVDVRINDRGPTVKGRLIDLSSKAASALGIKDDGVADVGLEILDRDGPATASAE